MWVMRFWICPNRPGLSYSIEILQCGKSEYDGIQIDATSRVFKLGGDILFEHRLHVLVELQEVFSFFSGNPSFIVPFLDEPQRLHHFEIMLGLAVAEVGAVRHVCLQLGFLQ